MARFLSSFVMLAALVFALVSIASAAPTGESHNDPNPDSGVSSLGICSQEELGCEYDTTNGVLFKLAASTTNIHKMLRVHTTRYEVGIPKSTPLDELIDW